MKSWFILIGLAVGVTAAFTVALPLLKVSSAERGPIHAAPPKPEGPAPSVVVEEDLSHNFGILPQYFKGKHPWTFKNTGAGPLELKGSSSTCSCTTSDLFEVKHDGSKVPRSSVVPRGESRTVEVSFDTKANNGQYRQSVTIATNDPEHPQVVLKVEGTVRPAITTVPSEPSIQFSSVSNEDPTVRMTALYSSDKPDLQLTRLVSSNPALIGVESRPMKPDELASMKVEKGYVIQTTVKPSSNLGDFAEEVLIETDHPMMKELRFKVRGKVTGPISVMPEKVTMRDATSSNGGHEDLTLWARGRSSIKFLVEKKPPGMEVAIEPMATVAGAKSSKYKLSVKLIPGLDSGHITDEVVLKTDDPKVSELRVPVDVLVQGAR